MDFNEWLNSLPGSPTASKAADAAGLSRATAIRHATKNETTAEFVIAIARAFDVNEVRALVNLGFIEEAAVVSEAITKALRQATNKQLLDEINLRVDPESIEHFCGGDDVVDVRDDSHLWVADSSPDEDPRLPDDYKP